MRRSALPLPRYVLRKPIKSGWAYFFNVPMWARAAGCPLRNEPLGTEYEAALHRAERVLLPAFDSWRSGGATDAAKAEIVRAGTLDWVLNIALIVATPRSMPGRSATTRSAFAWSAVTS
jgi:hypothetical protein